MSKSTNTTTKDRQIEFMWHLYGQGFTMGEIAKIYNVSREKIDWALQQKAKKLHHERSILS